MNINEPVAYYHDKLVYRDREVYDQLCAEADALLAKYNPCAGCTGCSRVPEPWDCCEGCPFLGPQGCTTQCLACKLWLCSTPNTPNLNRPVEMIAEMVRLKGVAYALNLHYARATPEEILALGDQRESTWYFYRQGRQPASETHYAPRIYLTPKK